MFEKWRIKEHMEVTDASGRHLGTVDSIDGDVIKLTRGDAADGLHHYVDVKWIDKIEDNRASLKAEAPLREPGPGAAPDAGKQSQGYDGAAAEAAGFAGVQPGPSKGDAPLFGTSGHGTGMGGSGVH